MRAPRLPQEAAALARLGWQFAPDRVLVQFYPNDAELSRAEQADVTARLRAAGEPLRGAPIKRSAPLWVAKRALTGRVGRESHYRVFFESYRDESPGWQRRREALRRMADSARARDVPITLVLFPDFMPGSWTPETYPLAPIYRKVAGEALDAGFDVLDLTGAYAAEGGDWRRWWATAYDGHPNTAGQLVAARAIADYLVRHGWPTSQPGGSPVTAVQAIQ